MRITKVYRDSEADGAGLRVGDVIAGWTLARESGFTNVRAETCFSRREQFVDEATQQILETEAQICLLSTVALCFLMILTTRVQRFFKFVEASLISRLKDNQSKTSMVTHVRMIRVTLTVASIISLVVKILLFAVIVHVLYSMKVERTNQSSLWYYLVISTVVFMLLELYEICKMGYYAVW